MTTEHLTQIARDYFNARPEAKAEVIKKGKWLLRPERLKTHRFEHRNGQTKCWICGQDWYAKEMIRCPGFKREEAESMPETIKRVLADEHRLYQDTIARCERTVRREHQDWSTLTGEKIAVLHHTHGCGPEELEWLLDSSMPVQLRRDYEAAMEVERGRSRTAMVRTVALATSSAPE